MVKGDNDVHGFIEKIVCSNDIEREAGEEVILNFRTPAVLELGAEYMIGIRGYEGRNERRHALFLTSGNGESLTAYARTVGPATGFTNMTRGLMAGTSYELTISTSLSGSTLTLREVSIGAVVFEHFDGTADYTPRFFIDLQENDLIVESISY